MRIAVINLGTNTFHLLVADVVSGPVLTTIFKQRKYVFLGEKGLDVISMEAFDRGLAAIKEFKKLIESHNCDHYKAVGTSALRNAKNSSEFLKKVTEMGIDVEVIEGKAEAKYIAKGVQLLSELRKGYDLIMDIGGGSVEYSIISSGERINSFSFKTGLSVLRQLKKCDPISTKDIIRINSFLDDQLSKLFFALANILTVRLIGASGVTSQ